MVGKKLTGASDDGLDVVDDFEAFEGVELIVVDVGGSELSVGLDDGSELGDLQLGVAVGMTVGAVLAGAGVIEYFMFPALCGASIDLDNFNGDKLIQNNIDASTVISLTMKTHSNTLLETTLIRLLWLTPLF